MSARTVVPLTMPLAIVNGESASDGSRAACNSSLQLKLHYMLVGYKWSFLAI